MRNLLTCNVSAITVAAMNPPSPLTCAAPDCSNEFYPVVPQQRFCCGACQNRTNVRNYRAKRRKGGGDGGGGNGGGADPTLFDTITPVDAQSAFVPIPVIGPKESERKPVRTSQESRKAAA